MAKRKDLSEGNGKGIGRAADGHPTLDGHLWHTPKMGSPFECEHPGCEKVLGAWRNHDPLEAILADADSADEAADADDQATA